MNDLINRQDAIDALDVLCQEHRYKIPGKAETYSQYNEAWQDVLDRAEGIIGNLPSAQLEQRWIPCSEKLPDTLGSYLCTCSDGHTNRVTMLTFQKRMKTWNLTGTRAYWKVLAWMSLPDAYKESEE